MFNWFQKFGRKIIGPVRDPMAPGMKQHLVLAAFLAWVGIGADGLSSANYGPQEAYIALAGHNFLAIYLAIATALTVFVISTAYNQVIELFPSGGGGYKVASNLLGPYAGLVSGAALTVDYVLTIAISIASGVDALLSLVPPAFHMWKLELSIGLTFGLLIINLRGVKESIKILLPVFLGFLVTHLLFIICGIFLHREGLGHIWENTQNETVGAIDTLGPIGVIALLLRAFALGGGTYTGIEAVSNNVHMLKEPRIKTAKVTMLYMAVSLAAMAGGLILLYLLWGVQPVEGKTLNAIAFSNILEHVLGTGNALNFPILTITMFFAAAILFVGANTGYLAGPAVLANMARGDWMPHQFSALSSRLVTYNGMILMAIAAAVILAITRARVELLVVLYSINVFLTFSLSLLGLCRYWLQVWKPESRWIVLPRLALAFMGLCVTGGILVVTVFEKFTAGGWLTIVITGTLIGLCMLTKRHYERINRQLNTTNQQVLCPEDNVCLLEVPAIQPAAPTAVFFVGEHIGMGMQMVHQVLKLFPDRFKNLVFLRVGEVDAESYEGDTKLRQLKTDVEGDLKIYCNHAQRLGFAANCYHRYGQDKIAEMMRLYDEVGAHYSDCIFFATKLIFEDEGPLTRLLHNNIAYLLQRRLHLQGDTLMLLPVKV